MKIETIPNRFKIQENLLWRVNNAVKDWWKCNRCINRCVMFLECVYIYLEWRTLVEIRLVCDCELMVRWSPPRPVCKATLKHTFNLYVATAFFQLVEMLFNSIQVHLETNKYVVTFRILLFLHYLKAYIREVIEEDEKGKATMELLWIKPSEITCFAIVIVSF